MKVLLATLLGYMTVLAQPKFSWMSPDFEELLNEEDYDLANGENTMGYGTLSSPGIVNSHFLDEMEDMLEDDPELVKQIFEEPIDYEFDYDSNDAFEKFMQAQG